MFTGLRLQERGGGSIRARSVFVLIQSPSLWLLNSLDFIAAKRIFHDVWPEFIGKVKIATTLSYQKGPTNGEDNYWFPTASNTTREKYMKELTGIILLVNVSYDCHIP